MNWLPEHAPTLSFAKMAPAQIVAINAVTQVAGLPISPPTWEPKSTGGRFGGISGYNTPQNPCLERISGNCSVAPGTNTQNPNPHRLGFFCPLLQCWCGFRAWPRERRPCEGGVFAPTNASLFSVFSGGHASVLEATSFAGAGLEAVDCGWQLL